MGAQPTEKEIEAARKIAFPQSGQQPGGRRMSDYPGDAACFTDANDRAVRVGDRVQYIDGRNGIMIAIFQDGSGYVRFDGGPGDTDINWKHVAKWPEGGG